MTISDIRARIATKTSPKITQKQHIREWLASNNSIDFEYGLTLMPKKVFYKHVPKSRRCKDGLVFRHLNKNELETASLKFVHILNKLIYKKSYQRELKKLDIVMTIEGIRSSKDLHTHFALTKPKTMPIKTYSKLVRKAMELSGDFMIYNDSYIEGKHTLDEKYRYKLDIIDSEWLYYITKELDNKTVHNLYLP